MIKKLWKTKKDAIVYIAVTIAVLAILAFLFNDKLNKQFHALSGSVDSITAEKRIKNPFNFTHKVNLSEYEYKADGCYYSCRTPLATYKEDAKLEFDKNGVVRTFLFDKHMYHPVQIASFGNIQYSNYIHKNEESFLKDAVIQADFFVEMASENNGYLFYTIDDYTVPGTTAKLKAPWASAMAQGEALSLLSRIYKATGDIQYYIACRKVLAPLTLPVENGGLQDDFNGHVFYEEYPSAEYPTHVLNGFMFTLIGLYDCYENTGIPLAKKLYDDGIKTLKFALPYYDNHNISLYHLGHLNGTGMPVHIDAKYHYTHINQLDLLYSLEKENIFKYYRDRWNQYVLNALS